MLKKLVNIIHNNWYYIIFAIIVLVTYGRIVNMYWWVDDWGLLFKMIHPQSTPGNLGAGIVGSGPYRYLATPFIYLFPLFKYSTESYFIISLALYFLASILVFKLVHNLTKDRFISFLAGAIFSSGYIGSYAIYRLSNSYQLIGSVIFTLLTLIHLTNYYIASKKRFYFYSIVSFLITLEFFFLRSNGIILAIIAIFLWNLVVNKRQLIKNSIIQFIPFFTFYYLYYFRGFAITPDAGGSTSSGFLTNAIDIIFHQNKIEVFINFILDFIRMILPSSLMRDILIRYHYSYTYVFLFFVAMILSVYVFFLKIYPKFKKASSIIMFISLVFISFLRYVLVPRMGVNMPLYEGYLAFIGVFFLSISFWIFILRFLNGNKQSILIIVGITSIISSFATYFVYNPETNLDSSSRYVLFALVGVSILIPILLSLINRKIALFIVGIYCFVLISETNKDVNYILKYVSLPDKKGYDLISRVIPKVDDRTVIYIETVNDPVYKNNVLGGMPQLGISIMKGYDDNVKIAESYEEVIDLILKGKTDLNNVYTFYYDENGYIDTTSEFVEILKNNVKPVSMKMDDKLEFGVDYPSLTPLVLSLNMKITTTNPNRLLYPYFDAQKNQSKLKSKDNDIIATLTQEKERKNLIDYGQATSKLAIDGKNDTGWIANIPIWNDKKRPAEFMLKLPYLQNISKIYWMNHYHLSTPIKYAIETSIDNKNWNRVLSKDNGQMRNDGEVIVENIKKSTSMFVRLLIFETLKDLSPGIDEIWVSDSDSVVDNEIKNKIIECPFCYVSSLNMAQKIIDLEKDISYAKIVVVTNKSKILIPFQVYLDNKNHIYNINIPANGTKINKIYLDYFPVPAQLDINEAVLKTKEYLSF